MLPNIASIVSYGEEGLKDLRFLFPTFSMQVKPNLCVHDVPKRAEQYVRNIIIFIEICSNKWETMGFRYSLNGARQYSIFHRGSRIFFIFCTFIYTPDKIASGL